MSKLLAGTFASPYTGNVTLYADDTVIQEYYNYGDTTSDIEGTPSDAAFDDVDTFSAYPNADVTLTSDPTLTELVTINNKIEGTNVRAIIMVCLIRVYCKCQSCLSNSPYTGNVTLNDADDTVIQATDITTIDGDTTGTITVLNKIDIEGTPSDVDAAFDDVSKRGRYFNSIPR